MVSHHIKPICCYEFIKNKNHNTLHYLEYVLTKQLMSYIQVEVIDDAQHILTLNQLSLL